jgi:hypothetical protein
VARLKEKRRVSLRKKRIRNYKVILNVLIAGNQDIMQGIAIRSLNRTKSRIRNGSLSRKNIPEGNKTQLKEN